MIIFVSHSLKDKILIQDLKNSLVPHGIALLIAEHYRDLSNSISQKIENMIRQCDVALILLTENGYGSNFVQQEIGYIKSCNKPSLQVIEKGLENKITGFIYGHDFLVHDPKTPHFTVEGIKNSLLNYWNIEQGKLSQIAEEKKSNEGFNFSG